MLKERFNIKNSDDVVNSVSIFFSLYTISFDPYNLTDKAGK